VAAWLEGTLQLWFSKAHISSRGRSDSSLKKIYWHSRQPCHHISDTILAQSTAVSSYKWHKFVINFLIMAWSTYYFLFIVRMSSARKSHWMNIRNISSISWVDCFIDDYNCFDVTVQFQLINSLVRSLLWLYCSHIKHLKQY